MGKLDEAYQSFPVLMGQVMAEVVAIEKSQDSIRFYEADMERHVAKLGKIRDILAMKMAEIEGEVNRGNISKEGLGEGM